MKRFAAFGLAGLFSITVVAACGDDDDDTASDVQEANAAFCDDPGAYGTALQALAALDPATSTKEDYTSAVEEVTSSREALVSSGEDLSEAEWTNLQSQIETLTEQLRDAPDDATVSSILADAEPQATSVRASIATLDTAICTSASATTASS